jgi:curved DNA-binding protein CbpA
VDQAAAAGAACLHGLNAGDLALDLVRDIGDTEWLRTHIVGSPAEKLSTAKAVPAILPRLGLGASESFLLSRADGSLTLQQILEASPYGEVQTLQSLCALRAVGMITSQAAPSAPRPQAAGSSAHSTPAPGAPSKDKSATAAQSAPAAPDAAREAPAASTGPALTADQQKERREMEAKAREVASQAGKDYYAVLGVERTAPDGRIRQSYYRLARLYHPDRLRKPHLEDIHRQLEEMFAAITVAYTTLSRTESRAAYDRETSRSSTVKKDPAAERHASGREAFMRGRKALEGGEVYEAMRLFETAVEMDPAKAEYLLYLGRTEAHNPRWKKRAEEHFLKAIEMGPSAPAPYLELAKLYKSGGLERKALEMCKQVLKWDPDNLTAQQMLSPPKQDAAAGGILKSIFKKS